jgi:exonuclease III
MDYIRKFKTWKVLDWNIRGINSEAKQLAIREKIEESGCSVMCIQETKRNLLITNSLGPFVQNDLTILLFHHLWVPLVVS